MEKIEEKINELERKIDEMAKIIRKLYLTFLWVIIISIALVVLPFIGLMFAIPSFIDTYSALLGGF